MNEVLCYVPYGLKCVSRDGGVHNVGLDTVLRFALDGCTVPVSILNQTSPFGLFKPLLRPFSSVLKEIQDPMFDEGKPTVLLDYLQHYTPSLQYDDAGLFYCSTGMSDAGWIRIFDVLTKCKVDYRGLIGLGEAVDVYELGSDSYTIGG
nr:MAG TPA: hypothetical protein [Caudoviricetes sp.]